ncbi:MAG: histidine--tRNA ligase [Chitinivibrionales bacterium]|nr:histidine--tRNA ligase [Chitinivibrionales bacterium]
MSTFTTPKGTRDFYPEAMVFRDFIFDMWTQTCRRYCFEHIDAPLFEHFELYTQKSGEEIERQLYTFVDKGGRKLALRPELTPSVARMVAAKGTSLKRPIRWYSIPRLFRYERMQKGRLREFFQLNMDILGIAEVSADAELIAAVIAMMTDLGLDKDDFSVLISSRTLLEELFVASGFAQAELPALYALLDKKPKMSAEEFERKLNEQLHDPARAATIQKVFSYETLDDIEKDFAGIQPLADLMQLFSYLTALGLAEYVRFDIGIVRGLAYYTGIVFEVFDKHKSMRAVAGGGRYDNLVSLYGGQSTPAVGFAAGDVVLGDLLMSRGIAPPVQARADVYLAEFAETHPRYSLELASLLRSHRISVEYSLKSTGFGKQMKQINALGIPLVVIAGSQEAERNTVKVKDMRSGEEEIVDKSRLIAKLSDLLSHR